MNKDQFNIIGKLKTDDGFTNIVLCKNANESAGLANSSMGEGYFSSGCPIDKEKNGTVFRSPRKYWFLTKDQIDSICHWPEFSFIELDPSISPNSR